MPVFQDSNGLAIKFFIQKDLPHNVQAEICDAIATLGGRVESKVPRQGFVLTQPGTPEEERLRLCWTSPDRPDRHFVPFTYVEACRVAGMVLDQIFVHDGQPMKMHIHHSILNPNARAALSQRILHSGGDPNASAQNARVILADPNTDIFSNLIKTYQAEPEKYIESYLWVKKCVEKGSVSYTPVVYKNPGGRRPGEERTHFTEEDEVNLCNWIAIKIPYKETGGRTGNRLYQHLCNLENDPDYGWVKRHTWQSWRERYKKNYKRLDRMITQIVDETKPAVGEKGQMGFVRAAEAPLKKPRKKRVSKNVSAQEESIETFMMDTSVDEELKMMMHAPPPHPTIQSAITSAHVTHSPAEEEEAEWNVRLGGDPPPPWSSGSNLKSKRPRESEEPGSFKRVKTGDSLDAPVQQLHVVDQAIADIAHEYRFTQEEVQSFYDRCGEMGRTRERFRRMREELQLKFAD